MSRPTRSVLYIPGSKPRALQKARTLPVDAIIFDLEDAVAVDEKANARTLLAEALIAGGYGRRFQIVRVNGMDTPWGRDDLEALMAVGPQAVLLPKVETIAQVDEVVARLEAHPACSDTQVWAMIETAAGVLNAAALARAPRMAGFVIGTNDLAKELNCRFRADRLPLQVALQTCLLAARAAGIVCLDGVYNAFKDDDGLRLECEQGRDLGMDGKTLIHPAQIAIANIAFAPSEEEIELAHRQIAAFEAAEENGLGVAVVDGRIVENLHIVTARATLAKAVAIAQLNQETETN
ncbi:MAG: (3S)-malyl-CoA thioesterase [Paracoccaceae bacterium]|jgi:(3S)-malyl-CoA thioesterase